MKTHSIQPHTNYGDPLICVHCHLLGANHSYAIGADPIHFLHGSCVEPWLCTPSPDNANNFDRFDRISVGGGAIVVQSARHGEVTLLRRESRIDFDAFVDALVDAPFRFMPGASANDENARVTREEDLRDLRENGCGPSNGTAPCNDVTPELCACGTTCDCHYVKVPGDAKLDWDGDAPESLRSLYTEPERKPLFSGLRAFFRSLFSR